MKNLGQVLKTKRQLMITVEQIVYNILGAINAQVRYDVEHKTAKEPMLKMEYGDVHYSILRNYSGRGIYLMTGKVEIDHGVYLQYIFTNRRTHMAIAGIGKDAMKKSIAENLLTDLIRKYHIDMLVSGII